MKKIIVFIQALVILSWGFAQEKPSSTIVTTGVGTILTGDVAHARDDAINDALRKAVEQAVGTLISSETLVRNYQMVDDNILSWTRGYVQSYEIIEEGKKDDFTYQATLRSVIKLSDLKNDVQAVEDLIRKMGNPRVMVMIQEKNIGQSYGYFEVDMTSAETAIIDKFMQNGFECVDPTTVKKNLKREQALAALSGDVTAAVAIGHDFGAEVVITGKAVAKVTTGVNLYGMKSCQANLTARAIRTDTGTIIAVARGHGAKPHIDEITGGTMAIEEASKKAADELITKILERWRGEFYNVTTVKLRLRGVESYSQLSDFKNTLKYYIRGIKDIYNRGLKGRTAELDLKITGNAGQLARELESKDLENFKVQVIEVSPNVVVGRLEFDRNH